jgi:hypothetical protein
MTAQEYRQRLENNQRVVKEFIETGNIYVLKDIIYTNGERFESFSINKFGKLSDILGCTYVEAIPRMDSMGADGEKLINSKFVEIESKLSCIDPDTIAVGARGGLYCTRAEDPKSKTQRASLESQISGKFDSNMSWECVQSKARRTYLVVYDVKQNQFVDAWVMMPERVRSLIEEKVYMERSSCTIKLGRFIRDGYMVDVEHPGIGWEEWKEQAKTHALARGRFA